MRRIIVLTAALLLSACRSDGTGEAPPLDTDGPVVEGNCHTFNSIPGLWLCNTPDLGFETCCYSESVVGNSKDWRCWDSPDDFSYSCESNPFDPNSPPADPEGTDTTPYTTGNDESGGDPDACENTHALYTCRGYKLGVYSLSNGQPDIWDIDAGEEPWQCFDTGAIETCAPFVEGTDLTDGNDPLVQSILDACEDVCLALPEPASIYPPFVATGNLTRTLVDTVCVFEAAPTSQLIPDEFDLTGTHPCGHVTVVGSPPQIVVAGECGSDGGTDPQDCPVESSVCADWRPSRVVYANKDTILIDVDWFHGGTLIDGMFNCDGQDFVYSGDGTGKSYIDGTKRGEMLYEMGLRDGDTAFVVEEWKETYWDTAMPLNTYEEVLAFFLQSGLTAPNGTGRYRLHYERDNVYTSRVVEVKQCGSRCTSRDL